MSSKREKKVTKSTLIRAVLSVVSREFSIQDSAIAKRLGGVVVVVEKSAEAHELQSLCNWDAQPMAVVVEAPNDYNLGQGQCLNGTATKFDECLRRRCPDYAECSLITAAGHTQETPILILLHARYLRHMEDMTQFLTWFDPEGMEYRRTLLLVDELPHLFAENTVNLETLNAAEVEVDQRRPSYRPEIRREKHTLLYDWNRAIRITFFKLTRGIQKGRGQYGFLSKAEMEGAGFEPKRIERLMKELEHYAASTRASELTAALLTAKELYFSIGQTTALVLPSGDSSGNTGPGRPNLDSV